MVRKLCLVGMLVVAGRGSVAQLFLAVVISFVTFALQVKVRVMMPIAFAAALDCLQYCSLCSHSELAPAARAVQALGGQPVEGARLVQSRER